MSNVVGKFAYLLKTVTFKAPILHLRAYRGGRSAFHFQDIEKVERLDGVGRQFTVLARRHRANPNRLPARADDIEIITTLLNLDTSETTTAYLPGIRKTD